MQEVVTLTRPNDLARAVLQAFHRIQPHVRETPLLRAPWLSSVAPGCTAAYLKLESEQHTNSFKARGALNKILALPPQQLGRGLVTSSTGNAALAFVWACGVTPAAQDCPSTIYLPTTASPAKLSRLLAQGANVVQFGEDCVLAEREARRVSQQQQRTYISPYNDTEVMAGQGTIAVELLRQLPGGFDVAIVPVGGGGLIGGIAAMLKAAAPSIQVIGVQPAASDVMRQCVAAGSIFDAPCDLATLSDATAGGIEHDAVTLHPCMEYVDAWVNLSEQEIADAMVSCLHHAGKLVEGAAGCAIAAVRQLGPALANKRVVCVCCGGNVALPVLKDVLNSGNAW